VLQILAQKQGFRYEKDCLNKKEETTSSGNENSGENPNRFNVKKTSKKAGRFYTYSHLKHLILFVGCTLSIPACLPEPSVGKICKIFKVDLSVKIEIGNVAVNARLPDHIASA